MIRAVVLLTVASSWLCVAGDAAATISSIEPRTGAPGTVLTISGVGLEASKVREVYLSDLRFNLMVKVLEQSPNRIVVRIPPFARPGRYQVLFLAELRGEDVLLEQPAFVMIQAGDSGAPGEPAVAQAPKPAAPAAEPPKSPAEPQPARVETAQVKPALPPAPAAPAPKPAPVKPDEAVAKAVELAKAAAPAPAPEETGEAVTTSAQVVSQSPPLYPPMARQMRLVGAVTLHLTVDSRGKVNNVDVIDGNPILAGAASDAVKRWHFKPATLRGRPVASTTTVVVNFGSSPK